MTTCHTCGERATIHCPNGYWACHKHYEQVSGRPYPKRMASTRPQTSGQRVSGHEVELSEWVYEFLATVENATLFVEMKGKYRELEELRGGVYKLHDAVTPRSEISERMEYAGRFADAFAIYAGVRL